jgi:hypothetical protein
LNVRTPAVRAWRLAALSSCPRLSHHSVQRIHVFLHVVLLEQFVCAGLCVTQNKKGKGIFGFREGREKKVGRRTTMCVSMKLETVLKTPSAPLGCSSHQRGKHSEKSL